MNIDFIHGLLGTIMRDKGKGSAPMIMPPPARDTSRFTGLASTPQMGLGPAGMIPERDPQRFTGLADTPQMGLGAGPEYSESSDDPQAYNIQPPQSSVSPQLQQLQQEWQDNQGKKYNKGVWLLGDGKTTTSNPKKAAADPNATVVTAPGKDRDKKWSLGEKIIGALGGFAQGGIGGAVMGATDRNFSEKYHDQKEQARLAPAIQAQQQMDNFNNDQARTQAQTDATIQAPILRDKQIELQRTVAANKAKAAEEALKSKDKLHDIDAANLKEYRDALIANGTKLTDAKIKQINERLDDYDLDRTQKREIADNKIKSKEGLNVSNQKFSLKKLQVAAKLREAIDSHKAALSAGKVKEAEESKKRILDYQQQLKDQ